MDTLVATCPFTVKLWFIVPQCCCPSKVRMPTVAIGPSGSPKAFGSTVPLPEKPYAPATFRTVHRPAEASSAARAAARGAWTHKPTPNTTRLLPSRNHCVRGDVFLMCICTLLSKVSDKGEEQ